MTKPAAARRSIVIEREMPHPAEQVRRALTQGALIEEWLMKNDFRPWWGIGSISAPRRCRGGTT
jgi:uncharacterized protein YndB with AHSA1/START domain